MLVMWRNAVSRLQVSRSTLSATSDAAWRNVKCFLTFAGGKRGGRVLEFPNNTPHWLRQYRTAEIHLSRQRRFPYTFYTVSVIVPKKHTRLFTSRKIASHDKNLPYSNLFIVCVRLPPKPVGYIKVPTLLSFDKF